MKSARDAKCKKEKKKYVSIESNGAGFFFFLFRQQRCVIKYPTEWRYNTIFGLYGHENNQPFLPPALHGNRDNRNPLEMLSTAVGAL